MRFKVLLFLYVPFKYVKKMAIGNTKLLVGQIKT